MKAKYKITITIGVFVAVLAYLLAPADAQYSAKVYKDGPDKIVAGSGGEIEVLSGGTLDVQSGASVTLAGTNTLSGTNALTGATAITGAFTYKVGIIDNGSTTTARTLLASESGSVCTLTDIVGETAAEVEFVLPSAAAGLTFTFVDFVATANADLVIQAATGDKINGGTAGKEYLCTGDAAKQNVTIVAIDDENWAIVAENGTWAADNS